MYFKGAWNKKFDASKIIDDEFFLLDGSSVQVTLMTSEEDQYIRAFDNFKVLSLPYKQGENKRKFSMYFLLPDARDGLPALVEKFSSKSGSFENHVSYEQVDAGDLRIPKFKISFGFDVWGYLVLAMNSLRWWILPLVRTFMFREFSTYC